MDSQFALATVAKERWYEIIEQCLYSVMYKSQSG